MGLTGDRLEGEFAGHRIALVRDNWRKALRLEIDGGVAASASRALPHDIVLRAQLDDRGTPHAVTARSVVRKIIGLPLAADDRIEVDGIPLPTRKAR